MDLQSIALLLLLMFMAMRGGGVSAQQTLGGNAGVRGYEGTCVWNSHDGMVSRLRLLSSCWLNRPPNHSYPNDLSDVGRARQ
jgi:hypothetical protein